MREYIGDVGHLGVLVGFVSALLASISYIFAHYTSNEQDKLGWKKFGRVLIFIHAGSIFTIIYSLFHIIQNHYYEYHYAWNHSSNFLPAEFMISCFWEGQEGSFLLWTFWHVIISLILLKTAKGMEAPVFAIFFAVQTFLVSMILGIVIFDFRIGSSPFILLKEAMYDQQIFLTNPDFIPADGTGLNPLLQNYWMVIHPPTLFLGFALTVVPFAYCIGGLWIGNYKDWIKPSMPWTLIGGVILGTGILMGGYWAYETLNFGGYWNWDPVENAVYIPWLTLIASFHTLALFKKNGTGLKFSIILVVITFILILYSTFLTRSGILGESSVHSFTDLGLSGQLLIYLLFFIAISIAIIGYRWNQLDEKAVKTTIYTNEFWVFVGMSIICIAAFQVFFGTSLPVINKIGSLKLAPPSEQALFYSKFQIWGGILITAFGALGQYLWWNQFDKDNTALRLRQFSITFLSIAIIAICIIALVHSNYNYFQRTFLGLQKDTNTFKSLIDFIITLTSYILLLAFSVFSLFTSGLVLKRLYKHNRDKIGGAITHIGVALMLIGILFSSAYDKIISVNFSGMVYAKEAPLDFNTENVLLWRNTPAKMVDYSLIYKGPRLSSPEIDGFLNKDRLIPISDDGRYLITEIALHNNDGTLIKDVGDTVEVYPENTYFEVLYKGDNGEEFSLYPRAQKNESMGLIASPDTRHFLTHDLYSFISYYDDISLTEEEKWRESANYEIAEKDTIFINDYIGVLDSVRLTKRIPGAPEINTSTGIMAFFSFYGKDQVHTAQPSIVITKENTPLSRAEIVEELGLRISMNNIDVQKGKFHFTADTTQLGYIILKVVKKPLINVLWFGTIILIIGFIVSIVRRFKEE